MEDVCLITVGPQDFHVSIEPLNTARGGGKIRTKIEYPHNLFISQVLYEIMGNIRLSVERFLEKGS